MSDQHESTAIDHLDFTITCSVGHPGGSSHDRHGNEYPPCPAEARFVSDIHDHPADTTHFWCAAHLSEHSIWIQTMATGQFRCGPCGMTIREISDLIYNLNIITRAAH